MIGKTPGSKVVPSTSFDVGATTISSRLRIRTDSLDSVGEGGEMEEGSDMAIGTERYNNAHF